MQIADRRREAVQETIAACQAVLGRQGVTRESLAEVAQHVDRLAAQGELFDAADFPIVAGPGERQSSRYLLHEFPDRSFALYMEAMKPGVSAPPHDHTTWVAIAAVEGGEMNCIYGPAQPGSKAPIAMVRKHVITPGQPIAYLPDDVHSIVAVDGGEARHLHLYGRALEVLDERTGYDLAEGVAFKFNQRWFSSQNQTIRTHAV